MARQVTNRLALTSLNLSRNPTLSVLPAALSRLAALEELDLTECRALRVLPPALGALCRLRVLGTAQCSALRSPPPDVLAQGVAAALGYLDRLRLAGLSGELALDGLGLAGATDDALSDLEGLRALSAAGNRLEVVSASLSKLGASLTALELAGNLLRALPPELAALTALTRLGVSHNQLEGPTLLGEWAAAWSRLRSLDARGNEELRRLPRGAAARWVAMEALAVDVEKFLHPPPEVLRRGARAAIEYCSRYGRLPGHDSRNRH